MPLFRKRRLPAKLVKEVENLIRLAGKVYSYRRDVLTDQQNEQLATLANALEDAVAAEHASEATLRPHIKRLDAHLRVCGGKIYPVTFWSENVEMILVAAILAIGIRTFFFQPFKIPTNSMYPTYNGMTPHVYALDVERPGWAERTFRFITLGAVNHQVDAPTQGEVSFPVRLQREAPGAIPFDVVRGRKWFGLLPAPQREYTLRVAGRDVKVRVPLDFNLDSVIFDTYFGDEESLLATLDRLAQQGRLARTQDIQWIETGREVEAGDPILDFDILTGDMLFVDRISYHFVSPSIGAPIVFRTGRVPGITAQNHGVPDDKYYIKRLVGLPGDVLVIREPVLYRNGEPIEGTPVFERNHEREGEYAGYYGWRRMADEQVETVPPGMIYTMGDNSPQSSDSRAWGFVPETEVIGRASFIFYPFSHRWGRAE